MWLLELLSYHMSQKEAQICPASFVTRAEIHRFRLQSIVLGWCRLCAALGQSYPSLSQTLPIHCEAILLVFVRRLESTPSVVVFQQSCGLRRVFAIAIAHLLSIYVIDGAKLFTRITNVGYAVIAPEPAKHELGRRLESAPSLTIR